MLWVIVPKGIAILLQVILILKENAILNFM